MLALTGKHADGWNGGGTPAAWGESLAAIREAAAAAGRPADSVVASANGVALLAGREDAERLLAEHPPPPMIRPVIGADGLRTLVEEWRESGCDHLILHFSGMIWSSYGIEQLDLAAEALGLSPS